MGSERPLIEKLRALLMSEASNRESARMNEIGACPTGAWTRRGRMIELILTGRLKS